MFRKGLGLVLLLVAGGVLAVGGLLIYRHHSGGKLPTLPADLDSSLDRVERGIRDQEVQGIRAEYLAGGAILVLLILAWALLRRRTPATGSPEDRRTSGRPQKSNLHAWFLALIVVCLCAGTIVALYFGPETIRISESIKIHRGPRDEFLSKVLWGLLIIGGVHVVYFTLFFLPRLFGRGRPSSRARLPR